MQDSLHIRQGQLWEQPLGSSRKTQSRAPWQQHQRLTLKPKPRRGAEAKANVGFERAPAAAARPEAGIGPAARS